jgi:hypothetical protein
LQSTSRWSPLLKWLMPSGISLLPLNNITHTVSSRGEFWQRRTPWAQRSQLPPGESAGALYPARGGRDGSGSGRSSAAVVRSSYLSMNPFGMILVENEGLVEVVAYKPTWGDHRGQHYKHCCLGDGGRGSASHPDGGHPRGAREDPLSSPYSERVVRKGGKRCLRKADLPSIATFRTAKWFG